MKSKLHYFDLVVCLIWILSTFCGRYYLNQTTKIFLGMVVLLRISLSFTLMREEKKTWMSLVVFAGMWGLLSHDFRIYNGIGEIANYFFNVTGIEYERYVDRCIACCVWVWIVVMPFVYYVYQLIRKKLNDTGMTKKELFGSILWHDRQAQYYCGITAITFFSLCAGYSMNQCFCQAMCFIAPSLIYWMICRYLHIKSERLWLLAIGSIVFWYGQSLGGIFRVSALAVSFVLIAYTCCYLYKNTKSHTLTLVSILYLGILIPTFSIGYNQYTCLNYPRSGYYYLAPYNGILYINDTTNGEFVGLRDRYGLLVKPEYESIRPGYRTYWGWTTSFLLDKDGYSKTYNIIDNEIEPSDINQELQSTLCNIISNFFGESKNDYSNKGEITVTEVESGNTIGHVRVSMRGNPMWTYENANFLPEDTAEVVVNQFLRTDSVFVNEHEQKNILCYAENIPNDSIAKYKVYVRLSMDNKPKEEDLKGIIKQVKDIYSDKW